MFRGASAHPPRRLYAIIRALKVMQTQHLWPTCADRTFAQACMECAGKEQICAHKGLVDVGFVNVDFVAGYICGSMRNS